MSLDIKAMWVGITLGWIAYFAGLFTSSTALLLVATALFILTGLYVAVMWVLVIRRERREAKERAEYLESYGRWTI